MDELEKAMSAYNEEFTSNQTETLEPTEIVEPTNEVEEQIAYTPPTEIVEPEKQVEETSQVTPDYAKYLNDLSNGSIKSEEDFKAVLPKISEYEAIKREKEELELKFNDAKPANEWYDILNKGIKSGWDNDRVQNFIKINSKDFNSLEPKEAKVANMVLNQGYSEDVARKIVERDFGIYDYEEDSDEYKIKSEELRISAKKDIEELNKYKAELTKIENTEANFAEKQRLENIANSARYNQYLKESIPEAVNFVKPIGEVIVNGKDGEDAVKLSFDFPQDFKASLNEKMEYYFQQTGDEVTQKTIDEFSEYAKADYITKNLPKLLQKAYEQGEALATEKAVQKYENRSGLPAEVVTVNHDNPQHSMSDVDLFQLAMGKY